MRCVDIYYKPISESGKQMINYVCKYAPVELFKGFGQECAVLEEMPENFDKSDKIAHGRISADSANQSYRLCSMAR